MKKVIFIGLFMALLSETKSQTISFSVPVGLSTNKVPTMGANLQLGVGGFILATGFDAQMSRNIKYGNLFWCRTGAAFNISELNRVELTAGAGQYRKSADVKSLNEGVILFNVQFVHQMESRPEASLFAGITTTSKFSFVSGGIRFTFNKREHDGCPSTWRR